MKRLSRKTAIKLEGYPCRSNPCVCHNPADTIQPQRLYDRNDCRTFVSIVLSNYSDRTCWISHPAGPNSENAFGLTLSFLSVR